jgi:hypothetical protein
MFSRAQAAEINQPFELSLMLREHKVFKEKDILLNYGYIIQFRRKTHLIRPFNLIFVSLAKFSFTIPSF